MSDQTPDDTPTGMSRSDNSPREAAQESTSSSESTATPDNTSPAPASASESQSGPTDSNESNTTETGTRQPHTFSYSLPIRMNNDGQNGGTGDTITWTFEVFPGPNQQNQQGNTAPPPPPRPPRPTDDAPGGSPDQPDVQSNNGHPDPDPNATAPPRPLPPPPFGLPLPTAAPRVGAFGLAGARPTGPFSDLDMQMGRGEMDPELWTAIINHLMPIFASGLADRRPDPAKAAELIRALPTIEKDMMDRVNHVISATEQHDDGWSCSICFDGADDVPAEGDRAVKVTPCNHLFHAGCLEPWFKTHTSCPMCRESMDSLRTQNDNETRESIRPTANRSTRTPSSHPYARPDGYSTPRIVPDTPVDATSAAAEAPNASSTPPSYSIWDTPAEGSNTSSTPPPWRVRWPLGARSIRWLSVGGTPRDPSTTPGRDPSTIPRRMPILQPFDDGSIYSGLQNLGAGSGTGTGSGAGAGTGTGAGGMPFMAMYHLGPHGLVHPAMRTPPPAGTTTGPTAPTTPGSMTNGPLHTSPMPMNGAHLPQSEATPNQDNVSAGPASEVPHRTPQSDSHGDGSGPQGNENPETPGSTRSEPPRISTVFLSRRQPNAIIFSPFENLMRDTVIHGDNANANDNGNHNVPALEPDRDIHPWTRSNSSVPAQPVTPPPQRESFASLIASKERDLGLVCASPECPYDRQREPKADKQETVYELLVVRSPSPSPPTSTSFHPASSGPDTSTSVLGVQKACAHKWHRDCLEKCQTLGDTDRDGEGKMLIKCGVCHVKGWVTPRDDTRSEGEVEKLVQWS